MEGMFACTGLEGVPFPAITRFKYISKLFVFVEEGGVNGNRTVTSKNIQHTRFDPVWSNKGLGKSE
jgi:hypothetical protein